MGKGVAACRNAAASRREIRVQPPPSSSQTMVHVSNQALVLREISVQCSQNAHPFHPAARSVSTGPGQRQRPNSLIRFSQKTRGGRTSLTFGSRPDFELSRLARSRFPGNRQGLLHVGVNRANDGQGVTQLGDITNFPTVKGPMEIQVERLERVCGYRLTDNRALSGDTSNVAPGMITASMNVMPWSR
ncbi:hypothetical protein CABS01_11496 [Colletotrichum abscissum]|uniref:uncharacterized protein n=1 Tax=Colletotrichum abscissum TaxID=1671311 RepID=UPI0027D72691|nr:uncharacterized protein CABS01_11496 [Colletotrichum abscissum]KAK1494480.1 hypothetical protein CABS01_11496 [Colletotrichum abscissum]